MANENTVLDRALDTEGDPLIPAEIKALILGNISDCRHVQTLCSDPRYAAICTAHHVYNMFVINNGWRLTPNNFTVQDFNRECNYYSSFLQHMSHANITPELYDRRMSYVNFIESFVENWYNQTLDVEFEEGENVIGMQQDLFCSTIVFEIYDAISRFIEPPYELPGVHITGIPDDDDLEYNSYRDEVGNDLEQNIRHMNDGNADDGGPPGVYIMVSSEREEDDENQNNFVVHYMTNGPNGSIRPLFTTGGVGANPQLVNQHRVRTVKKMTLFLIHHISEGLRNSRQYLVQQGRELPNTDPVLYEFHGPSLDALHLI